MKVKNEQTWTSRIKLDRTTCMFVMAFLALLWPGQAILASTLLSGQITGEVHLQGRQDHSGIDIQITSQSGLDEPQSFSVSPAQPAIGSEGEFSVQAQGMLVITASRPGYLDVQATVSTTSDEPLNLGATTLYGGEVTGDNLIDIGDLSYLGANFHTADAVGDINGDGVIDILDLSVAAANFQMSGPTPWGE